MIFIRNSFPQVCITAKYKELAMNVGVAHSDSNPTHSYFNSKGIWITYLLLVFGVHLLLLSVPFFSVAVAWTLTNVMHDVVCTHAHKHTYMFL